jgi:hypothetical protein
MGNIVDVQVTGEKIILEIPRKDIVHEIDNVASFNTGTKMLINTGVSQKVYQELYSKKWTKYKDRMEFFPAFSATSFNPDAAAMLLWDWWDEMMRQGVAGQIILRSQAKLEMNLLFDGYDKVAAEKKRVFEYLVFKFLYAKKLTINGVEKNWDKRNGFPTSLHSTLTFIIVLPCLILSSITTVISITKLPDIDVHPLLSLLLYGMIYSAGVLAAAFLGNFISAFLWILSLKPFFEREILLTALSYPGSQPQRHKIGKIDQLLINWMVPEKD